MKLPCTSSPHPNTRLGSLPTAAASASSPSNGVVDVELRTMVQELLDRRWSPEQISQHLRRIYPNQPERHLVPETIYKAIYVQGRGELRRELHRALRTDRAVPGHWEGDLTMGAGRNSD